MIRRRVFMVFTGKYIPNGKDEEILRGKEFDVDLPFEKSDDFLKVTKDDIIRASIPTTTGTMFIPTNTVCDRFHCGTVIRVYATDVGYSMFKGEFEITL
jgi:hypothetical protein